MEKWIELDFDFWATVRLINLLSFFRIAKSFCIQIFLNLDHLEFKLDLPLMHDIIEEAFTSI